MTAVLALLLACGAEDWARKTLADPGAEAALARHVDIASVEMIGKLAPTATRRQYETTGTITWHDAEADGDIHVVLAGAGGGTMVIEFPRADCLPSILDERTPDLVADAVGRAIQARTDLVAIFRTPPPRRLPHVRVRGMLFFDRCDASHQPRGHAPNCAELHPVTFVEEVP